MCSLSLPIKPNSPPNATMVSTYLLPRWLSHIGHLTANSVIVGPMVSFRVWTDAAITHRVDEPIQLYVSYSLCNSSGYPILENPTSGDCIGIGSLSFKTQYFGLLDEFGFRATEINTAKVLKFCVRVCEHNWQQQSDWHLFTYDCYKSEVQCTSNCFSLHRIAISTASLALAWQECSECFLYTCHRCVIRFSGETFPDSWEVHKGT